MRVATFHTLIDYRVSLDRVGFFRSQGVSGMSKMSKNNYPTLKQKKPSLYTSLLILVCENTLPILVFTPLPITGYLAKGLEAAAATT